MTGNNGIMNDRMMLLDDDVDILKIVTYLFTQRGYDRLSLNKVEGMRQHIRTFEPILMLMEVLLYEHNGIEICKMLKHEP